MLESLVAIAESNHGHADFQFRNSQSLNYNSFPNNQLAFRDNRNWKAGIWFRNGVSPIFTLDFLPLDRKIAGPRKRNA